MSDPHPRYVLRESVGRKIRKRPSPGNPVIREWLILDSWYCYRVVWQFFGWASPSFHGRRIEYGGGIVKRRQRAESELRKLNAARDAWLGGDVEVPKGKESR